MCIISCNSKDVDYTCEFVSLLDNYPQGVKKQGYSRQICCILKFTNIGRDSIFLPYYGRGGGFEHQSYFYVRYKKNITECSASSWMILNDTHVIAPGEHIRIRVFVYPCNLDSLKIKDDDIQEISKNISVFYKYNPADSVLNHWKTPMVEVKKDTALNVIDNVRFFY